jgi:hypothetical protein
MATPVREDRRMNVRVLYALIGVLVIVVIVLGVQLQHERQKTSGVSIELNKNGLSIEQKKGD